MNSKDNLGNPKPRIFRLEKDHALIDLDLIITVQKLYQKNCRKFPIGFLGINIGPNKDTQSKEEDYYICLSRLSSQANYITINISSPNTEGLRDFHESRVRKTSHWLE